MCGDMVRTKTGAKFKATTVSHSTNQIKVKRCFVSLSTRPFKIKHLLVSHERVYFTDHSKQILLIGWSINFESHSTMFYSRSNIKLTSTLTNLNNDQQLQEHCRQPLHAVYRLQSSAQISLSHVHVDRHQAAKDAGSLALACLFSLFRDVSKDGERNRWDNTLHQLRLQLHRLLRTRLYVSDNL